MQAVQFQQIQEQQLYTETKEDQLEANEYYRRRVQLNLMNEVSKYKDDIQYNHIKQNNVLENLDRLRGGVKFKIMNQIKKEKEKEKRVKNVLFQKLSKVHSIETDLDSQKSINKLDFFKSFLLYTHIKKFISQLNPRRKYQNLMGSTQLEILNDKGAGDGLTQLSMGDSMKDILIFNNITSYQRWKKNLKNKILKIKNYADQQSTKIPIFMLESQFIFNYEFFCSALKLYFIIIIPLDIGFDNGVLYKKGWIVTFILSGCLLLEFVFKLFTVFYEFGQPVTSRWKIMKHQWKKHWIYNFVVFLQLMLFNYFEESKNLQDPDFQKNWWKFSLFLFFIQIKNILKFIRKFEDRINLNEKQQQYIELLKLIMAILYVGHFFACLIFFIGYQSIISGLYDSWIRNANIQYSTISQQYLISYYFVSVTMCTIGYGDIVPKNNMEYMIIIIFMMICSFQLSYTVNTVGQILNQWQQQKNIQDQRLRVINNYMIDKRITPQLQHKIREYLHFVWLNDFKEDYIQEQEIMGYLNVQLKSELLHESHSGTLLNSFLFSNYMGKDILDKCIEGLLFQFLHPESVYENKIVLEQGLNFVERGVIEVSLYKFKNVVSKLQSGDSFNLINFILGYEKQHIYQFQSNSFSKLLILDRNAFLTIIKIDPEKFQIFQQLKDEIEEQNCLSSVHIPCYSCGQQQRTLNSCQVLHYIPNRERVIKQYQMKYHLSINERQILKKLRKERSNNVFLNLDQNQEACELFQEDHTVVQAIYNLNLMKATKLNIIEEEKKVFTAIKNIPQAINKKVSISENIVNENLVMKEPPIVSSSSPFKRTLSISSKFKLQDEEVPSTLLRRKKTTLQQIDDTPYTPYLYSSSESDSPVPIKQLEKKKGHHSPPQKKTRFQQIESLIVEPTEVKKIQPKIDLKASIKPKFEDPKQFKSNFTDEQIIQKDFDKFSEIQNHINLNKMYDFISMIDNIFFDLLICRKFFLDPASYLEQYDSMCEFVNYKIQNNFQNVQFQFEIFQNYKKVQQSTEVNEGDVIKGFKKRDINKYMLYPGAFNCRYRMINNEYDRNQMKGKQIFKKSKKEKRRQFLLKSNDKNANPFTVNQAKILQKKDRSIKNILGKFH